MRRHLWVLPLVALVAVSPLAFGGNSCGVDFGFHLQSWFDAAAQLHHGTLYPRWTFAAAYNSGEPRFTFYPPLSWELGGMLTLLLPFTAVPAAFTWIALCIAGFAAFRLTRSWVSPDAALLASSLFLANPFMLFTVATRSAFGELLAGAFCPLLFASMLREQPSVWSVGAPIALMWLSNVPGGIIATYLFVFLGLLRLILKARSLAPLPWKRRVRPLARLLARFSGGFLVALGFAAVYLLPAIHERPLIRMADAYPAGMRVTDNLLLHRILLPGRDTFLIHVEEIAAVTALAGLAALAVVWLRHRRRSAAPDPWLRVALPTLCTLVAVLFLQSFLSAPVWRDLPAFWVVQFPWRLLFVLSVCSVLAIALALDGLRLPPLLGFFSALGLSLAMASPAIHLFRARCFAGDAPAAVRATLQRHHTPEPTDEYTTAQASPGGFRPDNPPFWLAAQPQDYAPGTTPNTIDIDPNALMPAVPPTAQLHATPLHFSITSPTPAFLIVNLEDFPNWRVRRNGGTVSEHIHRPDGLITIAVPAGVSSIAITWKESWDERLGGAITLFTLLGCFIALLIDRLRPRGARAQAAYASS